MVESNIETTYYPGEIKYIFFETGEQIVSKRIFMRTDSIDYFMSLLIKGKVSLYSMIDNQLRELFFIESQYGGLRELKITEDIRKSSELGKWVKIKNKRYIGELLIAFQDAHWTSKQVESYKFTKEGLLRAVQDYHFSVSEKFENYYNINTLRAKNEFGVTVAASTLIGNSEIFESSFGKSIGISYSYFPARLFEKYSFGIGFTYTKTKLEIIDKPKNTTGEFEMYQIPITFTRYYIKDKTRTSSSIGWEVLYFPQYHNYYNNLIATANMDFQLKKNYIRTGVFLKFLTINSIGVHLGYIF
jgi:hypothetical protein